MKAVGVILAGGGYNERMEKLTDKRATSAMPIGSCYRALDFPLSNMSNSGINKVAVITQYNSRSLHDHLSSSKWWDLGRKQGGLFVFSPYLSTENSYWFRGTADSIYQNINYLLRSDEPYVVISSGDCIYKMDFNDILAYHESKNAEVTIVYKEAIDGEDPHEYGVLQFDENERLTDLEEKPLEPQSNLISCGIYVISRTLLIKRLMDLNSENRHDLVSDLFARYRKRLRIYGYRYSGYWKTINSVKAYYDCNMDFLKRDVRSLFTAQFPYIETKPKDEPPAKYNIGSSVTDCLAGSGTVFDGHVDRSVVFRKVRAGERSSISNSIVMEGCIIGMDCTVKYAILDKEVVLSNNAEVIGTPDKPAVITKSTLL